MPLWDENLGLKECRLWADKMVKKSGCTDEFIHRMLQSLPILASGHPRSIELIVKALNDESKWSAVVDVLSNRPTTSSVLRSLC